MSSERCSSWASSAILLPERAARTTSVSRAVRGGREAQRQVRRDHSLAVPHLGNRDGKFGGRIVFSANTRRLSDADRLIGGAERLGPVVMLRPFDMEFGHLALDDAGIGAEAAGPEGFGEDLAQDGVVKAQQVIRGKKDSGR